MAIVDKNGNPIIEQDDNHNSPSYTPKARHPLSRAIIGLGATVGGLGVLIFFVPIFAMIGGFVDPLEGFSSINSYWWGFWMMVFGGLGAALGLLFGVPKVQHQNEYETSINTSRKENGTTVTHVECWKCGTKNDKKATYCNSCGVKMF